MLDLRDISLTIGTEKDPRFLLTNVSAKFPRAHFAAIIGPSGCGKSTLLKTILGVATGDEVGHIHWNGRDLTHHDFSPSEIGYVPQFSIAYEDLTVGECVDYATRLRVGGLSADTRVALVARVLDEVGMTDVSSSLVKVISGGQKRRLALAMELASAPAMLLCDEVTSGLDPQSENEIVHLLHSLSRSKDRLVLSVTHSLAHLYLYDSIVVLLKGRLVYHGSPENLAEYFQCDNPSELYARLESKAASEWAETWRKHEASLTEPPPPKKEDTPPPSASTPLPGPVAQLATLTDRRLKIFLRNRSQILLQLGLVFGFPILVAIFAWNGLPDIRNLSMSIETNVVQQLQENMQFLVQGSKIGSLVSGIVMFQVILLTLMGANNSGREIAAERNIFEKEKLSGLRPLSYVASKVVFMSMLVIGQSLWMGLFVKFVCDFPGDLLLQLGFLLLVNGAMTSVCLAISSFMSTAEQASLASIYLVGFQLPLSGAVLALPEWVEKITQPFIAAYWSWSGILQTLRTERYYDIVQTVIQTALSPATLCMWVLCSHIVIGIFAAWLGCQRSRLD